MNLPKLIFPILVISALLGGYYLRNAFTQPTTTVALSSEQGHTLNCVVEGVKCKGTASFFTSLYEGVPGVNGIVTYASEHRAIIDYNPDLITPAEIKNIMEAPVPFNDGSEIQVFTCLEMKQE